LVGLDVEQKTRFVIEAKYWAGLTDAQPNSYLNSLPDEGALLLFVAPSKRLDTLWSELLRRCADSGKQLNDPLSQTGEQRHIQVGNHILGVVSWRLLLDILSGALDRAGDRAGGADVQQLQGLCEQMDSEAFLPLHSEELSGCLGIRIVQFGQIASDLTDILVNRGDASVKGLRATGGNGWFGRYLMLRGYGCFLSYSSYHWTEWGGTPLWLEVKGHDWSILPSIKNHMANSGIPCESSDDGLCCIPLTLLTGVEREAVIDYVLVQLDRIIAALPSLPEISSEF
jgi:hypothetical protein